MLDAIESYLATGNPQAANVRLSDGRQVQHWPILDLHQFRYRLRAEVAGEEPADRAKEAGLDPRAYKIRLAAD
jgi:hypothetical protein